MNADREMTLQEWVERLPTIHRARKEYEAIINEHKKFGELHGMVNAVTYPEDPILNVFEKKLSTDGETVYYQGTNITISGPILLAQQIVDRANRTHEAETKLKKLEDECNDQPTKWAYDQACAALHKHKAEAEELRKKLLVMTEAYNAAAAFICCHAADPDITPEMVDAYDNYKKYKAIVEELYKKKEYHQLEPHHPRIEQ